MPEFNFKSPVVTRKVRETEMIFKGSYSDFIKVYLDIYKEIGIMLDADGRVILDKSINYGKQ